MPALVSSTLIFNSTRDSSSTTSGNIAVQAGDVLTCKVISEDSPNVPGTPVTAGQIWRLDASTGADPGHEYARIYTTVAASTGNKTVAISTTNNPAYRAAVVNVWRGATLAATPATNSTKTGSGAPNATLTTTAANSVIDAVCGDWNTSSGSRTYESGAVEEAVRNNGAIQAEWFHQDAPTAGPQTIGLSAPGGQEWAMLGIEIKADTALTQNLTPTTIAAPAAPPQPALGPSILPTTITAPTPPQPAVVPGVVDIHPATIAAPTVPAPRMRMFIRPTAVPAPPEPDTPALMRTPGPPLRIDWWAINDDNSILCPLPDATAWDLSLIPGEAGAVRLEYPVDGRNYDVLAERVTNRRDLFVHLRTDGTLGNSLGAILQARDGDDIAESGTVTFTGIFLTGLLNEARIAYNAADTGEKGETHFAAANAGQIIEWFMQDAQTRGKLTNLSWTFTDTHDSAGTPWPGGGLVSATFSPGGTLLELHQQLRDWGLIEFEITTELELRIYVPETIGVDRTLSDPPVVLRWGHDPLEAPHRAEVQSAITDLLVVGKDGVHVTLHDDTARALRGRQVEGYVSEGNLVDVGSAMAYGQVYLARMSHGADELTHTLSFDQNRVTPLREIWPSDWVYSDLGNGLTRERVAQLTVTMRAGEDHYSGGVVLGELIDDQDVALQRQLNKLKSGSTITGTSEPAVSDGVAPAAPTGVVTDSIAYSDGPDTYATVIVGWAPVTLNEDGTAATDIAGYRVQWRLADDMSGAWILAADTPATGATFGGVAAGVDIFVRVACYDRDGNQSAWTTVTELTENDTSPPPVPSAPVVSSSLGVLMAYWDGLGAAGEQMPADFAYVEVHVSIEDGFTPSPATYYDRLFGAGTMPIPRPDNVTMADWFGVTRFVRLVAVDMTTPVANVSAPGGQGSGSPSKVVGDEIFEGAVGSLQLADLAVTTAKINFLAVNDAQVGNLSVGKLTAGTFTAALTLSGIFRTGNTGARGEWDSTSFRQYDATGTQTLGFVPGGVSFMTGEFRTALAKQRMVINPGGTVPDEIRIYPSGGGDYARIMSRTAPADGSAAVLIDGGAATGVGRGRLGAYKNEAFVSWVTGDSGGDTSAGYSRTAVSCASDVINTWAQTQFSIDKYSGNTRISQSRFLFTWINNGGNWKAALLSERGTGLKFDDGRLNVVDSATGNSFANFGCNDLNYSTSNHDSSRTVKQDITDVTDHLDPLATVASVPIFRWRYRDRGPDQPLQFGPMWEDLPTALQRTTIRDGVEAATVGPDDLLGVLWAAVRELILERRR